MQTSYSIAMAAGMIGALVDTSMVQDILTFKNIIGEVKIGHLVSRAVAEDEIKHPGAAADITSELKVRGVVVHAHEMESVDNGETPGYAVNSVVPVMRKGRIWAMAEDAITEGTSTVNAYWAVSSPSLQLGAFRGSANSSFTAIVPKAKWRSSTTGANGLAILELDL